MKISSVLILAAFFYSFVEDAVSQNSRVNIQEHDISVGELLSLIENQTDYLFLYSKRNVDVNRKVSVRSKEQPVAQVLNEVFRDTDVRYTMEGSHIILTSKDRAQEMDKLSVKEKNQQLTITGTVTDESGEPLPGVNVVVKGTTIGVITRTDGKYAINVPNKDAVLSFSFLGFATQEFTVGDKTVINVSLREESRQIEEVVVTALGIKRAEKALSYNVQVVNNEDFTTVKSANFMNALAGKAAGVTINSSAAGPGAAVKVVMRGVKSLSKDNNALYVIDGIPMYNSGYGNGVSDGSYSSQPGSEGAADINPDDIESISLLTGPSAAALYGYEGANGVVLITTKKGSAEKTTLTVSNSTTFSNPLILPDFQNTYGNRLGEVTSWGDATAYRYDPSLFFNTGSNVSNSVSLSTGNAKNQTYLSAASTNSQGILPNNSYDRYNFSFRNTASMLDDKLVLDASLNYIIQKDMNMVSQGQYFNPLPTLYLFPRGEDFNEVRLFERYDDLSGVNTQFWIYGDQGLSIQNPYWIMHRMNRESDKRRYKLSANLQYNVTPWLNIMGRVNVDNATFRNTEKRYAGTLATFAGTKGYYRLDNREERQTYADVIANLNKYFGAFSFTANLGASIKDQRMTYSSVLGNLDKVTNLFTIENIGRTTGFKPDQDGFTQQAQSLFANAEAGYKSMLYLTLTGRNDWDSALAFSESGTRSFFYPSVGLSGVISEMMKLPEWFSYLKTRVSYTSVGTAYDPYITREIYEYNPQTNQYNTQPRYPNRNLKPEKTNSYEVGLNMRFLKGTLRFDATYYTSNTLNQTFVASIPTSSGYSGVYVQAGDVENSGVEIALGYDNTWKDFRWATNLTYSYNNNIVRKLANGITNPVTGEAISMPYLDKATLGSAGSPVLRLTEGGSMGDIYVNKEWKRDDNGYILLDAKTFLPSLIDGEYRKVGSLLAKTHAGWRNTFAYKGIALNVLLSGRFGGLVVSNTQAILDRYGVSASSVALREAGGVVINEKTVSAENYLNIVAAGTGQGAHYVYNATNVRLGEVSLEYTIPKKWTGNVAAITMGLVGNNLAMIYCKAPFDPELVASATNTFYTGVDYFMQPSLRNFGFNIKLQF
ncbi:MAG: SusC/RagA family TonB-linked outer membrane protein [Dysgonamonadaceae bacterium]|nr:SusC/RagA family TonB-linked outer membrane protein [Dysgonamonadaceae bacterium]